MYPEKQRKTLSEYDNSIRYNDYVIDQLINLFKDKSSIVLYFPDHGLDMYETDSDYFGHAKGTDDSQLAAKQIPFFIYLSNKIKKDNTEIINKVQNGLHRDFSTSDMIYTLMDIMGFRFSENKDVEKYSIFR